MARLPGALGALLFGAAVGVFAVTSWAWLVFKMVPKAEAKGRRRGLVALVIFSHYLALGVIVWPYRAILGDPWAVGGFAGGTILGLWKVTRSWS